MCEQSPVCGSPRALVGATAACAAQQDEYCEWSVTKNDSGKITRVTFTCEGPEYWEYLARTQPETLLQVSLAMISNSMNILLQSGLWTCVVIWAWRHDDLCDGTTQTFVIDPALSGHYLAVLSS